MIDTAEQHGISVSVVARGLEHPWAIAFLPDGDMLITERDGRLRVVRDDRLVGLAVSGVPEVRTDGNGGLMDVAVHPEFAANRLVYLTYTKGHDDGRGSPALARARLVGHALHDVEDLVVTAPFHTNSGPQRARRLRPRRQGLHVDRRPHPLRGRRSARRASGSRRASAARSCA